MDCRMNVGIAWQEGDGEQVALHARKVATPAAIKKEQPGGQSPARILSGMPDTTWIQCRQGKAQSRCRLHGSLACWSNGMGSTGSTDLETASAE